MNCTAGRQVTLRTLTADGGDMAMRTARDEVGKPRDVGQGARRRGEEGGGAQEEAGQIILR